MTLSNKVSRYHNVTLKLLTLCLEDALENAKHTPQYYYSIQLLLGEHIDDDGVDVGIE